MFDNLSGMMENFQNAQKKVEETKKRLDTVSMVESSADANISITITANREIKDIKINESLLDDKEALEDFLVITMNKAIQRATAINEAEMAAAAKSGLPDLGGMF